MSDEEGELIFPSRLDFLEKAGLEPCEEDDLYVAYKVRGQDRDVELEFSFSPIMESFQVVLRHGNDVLVSISSELVSVIEMYECEEIGLKVDFSLQGANAEMLVSIWPSISIRWATLRAR